MRAIRVAVLDRHPAMRAGLEAILRGQPGMVSVGAAGDRRELWPLLYRARPDVVIVEHDPGGCDGVGLCLQIASQPAGPRVVLWTSAAAADLGDAAALAGAVLDSTAGERELAEAIRSVAAGEPPAPIARAA